MRIYWSIKSIPELGGLDRAARKRIWRPCAEQTWGEPQLIFAIAVFAVWVVVGRQVSLVVHEYVLRGLNPHAVEIVGTLAAGAIGVFLGFQIFVHLARPLIRLRRPAVCPSCGHSLRATFQSGTWRCPECGWRIKSIHRGSKGFSGAKGWHYLDLSG